MTWTRQTWSPRASGASRAARPFDSVPVLWTTPSALLCRVNAPADPASAAGRSATIRLSVDGIAATPASAASIFTFLAASATASIDGISPASSSAAGGLSVCLDGSGLLGGGSWTVLLGDAPCIPNGTLTATQLCCVTTAHAVGAVSVQLRDVQSGSAHFSRSRERHKLHRTRP